MRALLAIVPTIILFSWHTFAQTSEAKLLNPADAAEKQHQGYVDQVEFSRDGTLLVTASTGTQVPNARAETEPVKLWDVSSGKLIREFSVAPRALQTVALSQDGQRIAIATAVRFPDEEMVQIWDVASGSKLGESDAKFRVEKLVYASDSIFARCSPDWAADGRFDQLLELSPANGTITSRKTMDGAYGSGNDVVFTANGQYVVAGYQTEANDDLGVWETASGRRVLNLPLPSLRSIAVSKDNSMIAIGKDDGVGLYTFDGNAIRSIGQGLMGDLAFSPNGVVLACGGRKGKVVLYSVKSGGEILADGKSLINSASTSDVTKVVFSPDGLLLAVGWSDGTLRLYNTSDGKFAVFPLQRAAIAHQKPPADERVTPQVTIPQSNMRQEVPADSSLSETTEAEIAADKKMNVEYGALMNMLTDDQRESVRGQQQRWIVNRNNIVDPAKRAIFVQRRAEQIERIRKNQQQVQSRLHQ